MRTTLLPIRPVPPNTTIFMVCPFLIRRGESFGCVTPGLRVARARTFRRCWSGAAECRRVRARKKDGSCQLLRIVALAAAKNGQLGTSTAVTLFDESVGRQSPGLCQSFCGEVSFLFLDSSAI